MFAANDKGPRLARRIQVDKLRQCWQKLNALLQAGHALTVLGLGRGSVSRGSQRGVGGGLAGRDARRHMERLCNLVPGQCSRFSGGLGGSRPMMALTGAAMQGCRGRLP